MREFHIGDILSITTGYMMSPEGIGGVYEILNYMTDDNLFTHQLPRAAEACRGPLLAQHPQLADVNCAGVTPENHAERLAALVAQFGERLAVAPVGVGAYEQRDPIVDLAEMTDKPIVMVVTPE